MDNQKKEPLGKLKNARRTSRKNGDLERVKADVFPDKRLGKVVLYGVYDHAHKNAGGPMGIRNYLKTRLQPPSRVACDTKAIHMRSESVPSN